MSLSARLRPDSAMRCEAITWPVVAVCGCSRSQAAKVSGVLASVWTTPWQAAQLSLVGSWICTTPVLQLAVGRKCCRLPGIVVLAAFLRLRNDAGGQQRSRVGPTELAVCDRVSPRRCIGVAQVAEEAVHLHHARLLPVPRCQRRHASRMRSFGVGRVRRQVKQRCAVTAVVAGPPPATRYPRVSSHSAVVRSRRCVAGRREIAIGQRVPLAKDAPALIPGLGQVKPVRPRSRRGQGRRGSCAAR